MKKALTLLPIAAALAVGSAAQAADFPSKAITMIVPVAPGGGTDTFGRKVAENAEKILKQSIQVENRAGGSGSIGLSQVLTSKPDGYTIAFVWNSPITTIPHSLEVPYKRSDYSALMSIGYSSYVICAQPNFPAKDGKSMLEELKKNPGKYTMGNDGVGGTMQLASERIFQKVGVKVRQVPFKGAGDTAKNFLGGHIDLYGGSVKAIAPHAAAGKAKCLLLTSADRNDALPGTSGLKDVGLEAEETVLWWTLLVPAKTPAKVKATLEDAFMKATATPEIKEVMAKGGAIVRPLGAKQTNQLIDTEYQAFEKVAASIGLTKAKQ
ncbi:MAG: Bug family tripartite tricarboxylate transporter substrate binding protein [Burkholderiaceae bacterium]